MARRRRSNRALSRRQRAVLVGIGLIVTALLVWLDRNVLSPPASRPSTSQQQTLATDLARYHGQRFEVVRVVDGDTLHLGAPDLGGDSTKVRLLGIDAPEMGTTRSARMYFAAEATAFAKRLALHRRYTSISMSARAAGTATRGCWPTSSCRTGSSSTRSCSRKATSTRTSGSSTATIRSTCNWRPPPGPASEDCGRTSRRSRCRRGSRSGSTSSHPSSRVRAYRLYSRILR